MQHILNREVHTQHYAAQTLLMEGPHPFELEPVFEERTMSLKPTSESCGTQTQSLRAL